MNKAHLKIKQLGQTSIEYIFLITVIALILFSIMGQIQEWLVGQGQDCEVNPDPFVCRITTFLPSRGYENYRFFRFR